MEAVPVLPFRNPLEVVRSLISRTVCWPSGHGETDAALLWLSHILEAERATRNRARSFVSYDMLIEDWRGIVERISTDTRIDFPATADEVAALMDEFINPSLRHHSHKSAEVALSGEMAGWIDEAYQALQMLAANGQSSNAMARLDAVRHEFRRAEGLLESYARTGRTALERANAATSSLAEASRQRQASVDETKVLAERLAEAQKSVEQAVGVAEERRVAAEGATATERGAHRPKSMSSSTPSRR